MAEPCTKYRPLPTDAAYCVCNVHWNLHSQSQRHLFWDKAEKPDIDKVISAVKRDTEHPCKAYTPSKDWPTGESAPDCVCGRPVRPSHPADGILNGIRKWKESHTQSPARGPCGHFHGTATTPGTCCVCHHKWINHSLKARTLAIEAYYDEHESYCKCIIMNGDVPCDCMSETEIQDVLDDIGHVTKGDGKKKKEDSPVMGCKQFVPKSTGNTHCKCGTPFHMHTVAACDGHASFLNWRAAHLSNKDLLTWFMLLGKTRDERIKTLKRSLDDPHFHWVPPANLVNPDQVSMLALLDALTGSHHIQSPTDIEKIEAKRRGENAVQDDLKLDEDDFFVFCHGCQEKKSFVHGQLCDECKVAIERATTVNHPKSGPALVHTSGEALDG